MQTPPNLIETLFERVEAYGRTTLELSKLKVLDASSGVIAALASRLIMFVVIGLFMLFLSIGMALFFGSLLEKTYLGFFIVAAVYLIFGTILSFYLRKWIKKSVSDLLFSQLDTE